MGGYVQAAMMVAGALGGNKEAQRVSKDYKKEARIATEEGLAESERIRSEGSKFEANQRLSYLKSGVSLRGSPLLVLADTKANVEEQAVANTNRTFAQRKRFRSAAAQARSKGRSAMLSGGSSATGAATTQYMAST